MSILLLTCTFTVIIRFIRPMAVIRKIGFTQGVSAIKVVLIVNLKFTHICPWFTKHLLQSTGICFGDVTNRRCYHDDKLLTLLRSAT